VYVNRKGLGHDLDSFHLKSRCGSSQGEGCPMKRLLLVAAVVFVILILAASRWTFDAVRACTRRLLPHAS